MEDSADQVTRQRPQHRQDQNEHRNGYFDHLLSHLFHSGMSDNAFSSGTVRNRTPSSSGLESDRHPSPRSREGRLVRHSLVRRSDNQPSLRTATQNRTGSLGLKARDPSQWTMAAYEGEGHKVTLPRWTEGSSTPKCGPRVEGIVHLSCQDFPHYQTATCLSCTPSGDNLPVSNLAVFDYSPRLSVGLVALSTLRTCCALPPALAVGHFGQSVSVPSDSALPRGIEPLSPG